MDKTVVGKNKTDCYVKLEYKTSKLKTKVLKIEEGGEISWNQEFLVPAQIPIVGGRLVFKVFDEDPVSDELIGTILVNIKDIIPDADGNPGKFNGIYDWKNVYGAPLGCSGKVTNKMNENPEIASFWKGRILVQCIAEETDKPLLMVRKIDEDEILKAKVAHIPRQFAVSCFVAGLLSLPVDEKEYWITLRIADKEWSSGMPKVVKPKFNRFNAALTANDGFITMPYLSI